jgi:pyruvate, orthophosphate dikinase
MRFLRLKTLCLFLLFKISCFSKPLLLIFKPIFEIRNGTKNINGKKLFLQQKITIGGMPMLHSKGDGDVASTMEDSMAKAKTKVKAKTRNAGNLKAKSITKTKKYVYFFGNKKADGKSEMKNLLGGKGANLAEMTNLGIPVPPGFTVTTEVCTYYYENKRKYPKELETEVKKNVKKIEELVGMQFGSTENPLLFSVRSGARASMPGMMDTVLNLGLNDETVLGFIKKRNNNERLGYDSYRRFVQMYSNVVLGVKSDNFEHIMHEMKEKKGIKLDTELSATDLRELVTKYKVLIREKLGKAFPENPWDQLWGAIGAVFGSWDNPRAREYRRLNRIPDNWGTAVNVQAMVFGNTGENSATGVAFTRDPATGERLFFGEYLINAQGEDVVAGIRTPQPINRLQKTDPSSVSLEEIMPEVYKELVAIYQKLEKHYKDMQDIEFTIQERKLYMLQTRNGKRTGLAAIRIAIDMVEERLIDEKTAIMRIEPDQLVQLLARVFEAKEKKKAVADGRLLAKGLNAGPGAATGKIVLSAEKAVEESKKGPCVLVRMETSAEDVAGMAVAQGILTATGGMTSHAAVVARGMGKPCITACGTLNINYSKGTIAVKNRILKEGDFISIDGTTGEVIEGKLPTIPSEINQVMIQETMKPEQSEMYQRFTKLMKWANKYKKIGVRTNADTPEDSRVARCFGAEGIGLCRTEHMFFGGNRIDAVREMILADDVEGRRKALAKIEPMQKEDFLGIYRKMEGLPVTIRTLDPPLHEFLPHKEEEMAELAKQIGIPIEKVIAKVDNLKEANPMLGHRGCRLGITYPEVTEMQTRAIIEAAVELVKEGKRVIPEIMIPLVGHVNEYKLQEKIVRETADNIIKNSGVKLQYKVGTMIELPRAALTADQIAAHAEFFSFGTNDLTQTTFGLSRDDAGRFLPFYIENKILKDDPFQTIDIEGVGQLIKMGVEKGRKARPELKIGICGEHGGDPRSVEFCHDIGLNYVSCSPYRVPVARLAAARAALSEGKAKTIDE